MVEDLENQEIHRANSHQIMRVRRSEHLEASLMYAASLAFLSLYLLFLR